jgi:NADPH-dependent 2,4-dienoyl-CoA reductase/sulfur reductase-like enzyme/nitrite reductase/ring-hydroxylating ferredoxin subunit
MGNEPAALQGPDLADGIATADLPDGGKILGHVGGEAVLLAQSGGKVFAVGATCTHYGGPLAEGIVADGTVRCPWHHACFRLDTGQARAPALNPIACWEVERRGEKIFVRGKRTDVAAAPPPTPSARPGPSAIVILGGGAAGHAAAETLRAQGYAGPVTLVSADTSPPYDRPNVSKNYLAGNAPDEWMSLRGPEFYREKRIELLLGTRATALDVGARTVSLSNGASLPFAALLIATGGDPNRLRIPGAELPHVHTLRTLADSRAIIAKLGGSRRAVVIGASFIGLEVAASLRTRQLEVTVVSPEAHPLEKVFGREIGDFVRKTHEEHGVAFRLSAKPAVVSAQAVTLESGEILPADLVVVGIGVRPEIALAEGAGLATDRGILVDAFLETSAPDVFAAGDVARYPDPRTGELIRIEHWVVAQRQGRLAALNMLGLRERLSIVPFFWSQHYDVPILYVGHAERWDETRVAGNLGNKGGRVEYRSQGRVLAVATIFRDVESLQAELVMEREIAAQSHP